MGLPRSDLERVINHYRISEGEYRAHPERYPLPPRGSGGSVLEQAAAIVNAEFAGVVRLAALAVTGYDPLRAIMNWKNNGIAAGTPVLKGFVFGTYNAAQGTFSVAGFTSNGVQYAWGIAVQANVPAQGSSENVTLLTYALNVASKTTFDVLAFIATGIVTTASIDFGSGSRIIGLKLTDFTALSMIANKPFTQVITVSPWTVAAEINTINMSKA